MSALFLLANCIKNSFACLYCRTHLVLWEQTPLGKTFRFCFVAPITTSVHLLNLWIVLVLPAKITHRRYKTNHGPCPNVFRLKQRFLQCHSPTGSWDVVPGECGCALCSNVKFLQLLFVSPGLRSQWKMPKVVKYFLQDSDVSFIIPDLSRPISEKFTTDF